VTTVTAANATAPSVSFVCTRHVGTDVHRVAVASLDGSSPPGEADESNSDNNPAAEGDL